MPSGKASSFRVPDGRPTGNEPFRQAEPPAEGVYHNAHDLREMYSRENTERRRMGGHTLRKHFTAAQDKAFIARALKIRDAYQTANNDDVAIVFVQEQIAAGKEAEFDPKLVELAKRVQVPKRAT
ncbi:MAG TPA: hypothetical protein VFH47_04950 [Candidatus Thermoplasmatota archaeon]|nr:hypothetical protein [Candidatus Thermoplasmatota archaeon]